MPFLASKSNGFVNLRLPEGCFLPLARPCDWQGWHACPRRIDNEAEILSEAHWTMSALREHNHKTSLLVRSTISCLVRNRRLFGSSHEQVMLGSGLRAAASRDDASWSSVLELDFLVINGCFLKPLRQCELTCDPLRIESCPTHRHKNPATSLKRPAQYGAARGRSAPAR